MFRVRDTAVGAATLLFTCALAACSAGESGNSPSIPTTVSTQSKTAGPSVASGTVVEYSGFQTGPRSLTLGPDGNIWFLDVTLNSNPPLPALFAYDNRAGKVTPGGTVTEYAIGLTSETELFALTAGADGNLWFGGGAACFGCPTNAQRTLARISTAGTVTDFSNYPSTQRTISAMTAGPDGDVWFAEIGGSNNPNAGALGRVTATGAVTEYPLSTESPFAVAAGPQHSVWFTGTGGASIARINNGGQVHTFDGTAGARAIALGPDGNIWFSRDAAYGAQQLGRLTQSGTVTYFNESNVLNVSAGPDGNVWFTASAPSRIGRITPGGAITEFTSGFSGQPGSIAAGSDGYVWFGEAGKIGKIHP